MSRFGSHSLIRSVLLPVAVLAAMVFFLTFAVRDASESAQKQQYQQTLASLERGVTSCYAIEGRYPPSFQYLKDHYGVQVDESKYIVSYDIFASNVRPDVRLIEKGNGGEPDV